MKHNGFYIRAIMFDADITIEEIATSAQCRRDVVSQTIHGKTKHQRVRQVISDKLGLPIHALWADATPSETKEAA
jgi:stress-induced morphogen